jgi:hypothetical protein
MIEVNLQNAGLNHNVKAANTLYENVAKFRYLGMTLAAEPLIHHEVKSSLNLGNIFYHSVQHFCFPIYYLKIQWLRYSKQ